MKFSKNMILALFLILFLLSVTSVSAHDSDNPGVSIDTPVSNEEVSGEVDINVTIDDHYETQHVNVTIDGITSVYSLNMQDKNPSDGWNFVWDTSNCSNGKYMIQAKAINSLGLTGEYNILVTLANTQKDVSLNVENITVPVNQQTNVIAKLLDSNSKGISNKNIEFLIDGNRISAVTDSNGIATASFTPSKAGKYNVYSAFKGDNIYRFADANSTITAIVSSVSLNVDPITAEYREKINLIAKLTGSDDNTSLSGRTVDFKVDGDFVGTATSNDEGIASLEYTVSKTGGNYVYSASLNETASQDPITATNLLYVPQSKLYVTVTSDRSGVKVGEEVVITYNVFNNGPDNAKNTIFRYTIPESLKYISADVTTGNFNYNPSSREITWNLGSIPVGKNSINIRMLATLPARNNLTASLSTDTYDESISNAVPTRYLTVEGDVPSNDTSSNSSYSGGYSSSTSHSGSLGGNNSGNPIMLLICAVLMTLVGYKTKR